MLGKLWFNTKAYAKGQRSRYFAPQSPHLPGALTRVGRFLYTASAGWIAVAWYSGYVNMRTSPGSGPQLILPGTHKVIGPPDRADKSPPWAGNSSNSSNTSSATVTPGKGGGKNPFPGATGSRLDQGFDFTSQHFNAPAKMRIYYAVASDSGWKGGGYIVGQLLDGPKKGMYMYLAEGVVPQPNVVAGAVIGEGTPIAMPAPNPYNGITGNVEAGWANPANPRQPLAQVSANPPQVAWDFYNYIRSLGGPTASSTGNAGYP